MALKHQSHPHPLVFHEDISNQSGDTFHCSGCEGELSGPCFSCAKCGFYLHKKCAEAPEKINHPFHRRHFFVLHSSLDDQERTCDLCQEKGKGFVYRCLDCHIVLDINCALVPRDTAGNFIKTLHVAHQHPLNLIANANNHLKDHACNVCSSKLVGASYACFECFIFFHKKCIETPIEIPTELSSKIDHPYHRKHQLILDFEENYCLCNLCELHYRGYFYSCSLCNVHIHRKCSLPPSLIADKNRHEHPFILLFRPNISFTCDACGIQGTNISYICPKCHLQVHKECISLPRILGINLHHHPIYRNFFLRLHPHDSKTWDCNICYEKVNLEHGSYYCSKPGCNFIVHVICARQSKPIELKNQYEAEKYMASLYGKSMDCITRVIKEINIGKDAIAAEIEHISHGHSLIFSNEIVDNKYCNGCVLPILSSFYYCSHCDFFLHKACAEFRRKTLLWFTQYPLSLSTKGSFRCLLCQYLCNGFFYKFDVGRFDAGICLRCAGAAISHSFTYQSDEAHHLFLDPSHEGQCSACGRKRFVLFRSKDCDFALDFRCVTLPHAVWHKCDKHPLRLAYGNDNDYPLQHYCDICEEMRVPKYWFYHCEVCNTAVHPKCALGKYPFFKGRSNFGLKNCRLPITCVQNIDNYPQCVKCGKPCRDLSLEFVLGGRNFVFHRKCLLGNYHDDFSDSE